MNAYREACALENVMYDRFLPFGSYVSNTSMETSSNRQDIWRSVGAKQFKRKKKRNKIASKLRKINRK